MKVGIIGYGKVGTAMKELFKDAIVYDKNLNIGSMEKINQCKCAFVCVPTPMNADGSCDTNIVENVIDECTCELIVLRSTVKIGFTREMVEKTGKNIVFQPEYYGETVAHPFANLSDRKWLSFGGKPEAIKLAIEVYKGVMNANIDIYRASSDEAEMAKYMENAFFATKVIFINEMYDLCEALKIDYNIVREIWTADPRIGKYHTFIYKNNRGFGGSCLPKDIASLEKQEKDNGIDHTLISAVIKKNKKYH